MQKPTEERVAVLEARREDHDEIHTQARAAIQEQIDLRFDAVDSRFDQINGRFDNLEHNLEHKIGNGNGSRKEALLKVAAPTSAGTIGVGAIVLYLLERLVGG